MSDEAAEDVLARKALRRQAYDARNAQEDKDELSKAIVGTFVALPEYASAQTVMWYIDARSEVPTRRDLSDALRGQERIVVPYCTVDEAGANKLDLTTSTWTR